MDIPNVKNTSENTTNGRQEALELISWMQTWEKYNDSQSKTRTATQTENQYTVKRSKRQRD